MEAFVYKWTHKPSYQWYVGYHVGTPDDGYICSSKTTKKLILENPNDWERTIVDTGSRIEMYELESEILQLFDARSDTRSNNRHNNHDGITRGGWNKGLKSGFHGGGVKKGNIPWNKGLQGVQVSTKKGQPNPQAALNGKKGATKVSEHMKLIVQCGKCLEQKTVAHSRACKSTKYLNEMS
jgi:hypothetical protein